MRIVKKTAAVLTAVCIFILSFAVCSAAQEMIFGDMDFDGAVSSADARYALRCSVSLEFYTRAHLKTGDIDSDGVISSADARAILRASVGLEALPFESIELTPDDFNDFITRPKDDIFHWNVPDAPEINAPSGTFTFTVYGYGHGVGLSQYGALSMEDAGYTYEEILAHYYTGTHTTAAPDVPAETYYPSTGNIDTEQLLARIVYQEIYGVTQNGKYQESLKAMTLCVFTLLMREDFYVTNKWDVGVCSPLEYDLLPQNLKDIVHEVFGLYITVIGQDQPIMSVYSGLAAGMTASSESVWGGKLSYLQPVESPFDMQRPGFITLKTYTKDELYNLIKAYNSSIELSDDPSEWLEILEHTASMDENRGYVTKIRVGDKILTGNNQFQTILMKNAFMSSCFTVTYTP